MKGEEAGDRPSPRGTGVPETTGLLTVEALWRFADRSQGRRDSYATRSSLLIGAAGLVGGGLVVGFEANVFGPSRLAAGGYLLALLGLFVTVLLSLGASSSVDILRSASKGAGLEPGARAFFSPRDTFTLAGDHEKFVALAGGQVNLRALVVNELFVSLRLQERRYRLLQSATLTLAFSVLLLVGLAAWEVLK